MSEQTKHLNQKTTFIFEELTAWKAILKFSIPAIIGMVIMGSYTFADKIIVANGVGAEANAGLLVSEQLLQLSLNLALMIATGTGAYIAVLLGKKDIQNVRKTITTSFIILLLIGVMSSLIIMFSFENIMTLMGSGADQLKEARKYLEIVVWGLPFYVVGNLLLTLLRAEGKAKLAALITIATAVVNVVVDIILIFGFGWGVEGAAVATLIGGYMLLTILPLIYIITSKETIFKFNPLKLVNFKWAVLGSIIVLGVPTFIRTVSGTIQQLVSTGVISGVDLPFPAGVDPNWIIGDVNGWQAVMAGAMPTYALLVMPVIGIIQGLFPLYAYNIGARNYRRVKSLFLSGMFIQLAYATLVSVTFIFFGGFFLEMFQIPKEYNKYVLKMYIFIHALVMIFTVSFHYQATKKFVKATLVGVTRNTFVFMPIYLFMARSQNADDIFNSYLVIDGLSILLGAVFMIFAIKDINRMIKKEEDHIKETP